MRGERDEAKVGGLASSTGRGRKEKEVEEKNVYD